MDRRTSSGGGGVAMAQASPPPSLTPVDKPRLPLPPHEPEQATATSECVSATVEQLQAELNSLRKAIAIINHLADEVDIHTAMDGVRQVVLELLDCEKVTLYLVSERRKELRGYTQGPKRGFVIRAKYGEGIAGMVAATGQLMNIADTYAHPQFNSAVDRNTGFHTRNLLCCAIQDHAGRNVAVLQALNKHGQQTFSPADENNLRLFGTHMGNTLVKARLHEAALREKKRLTALYSCFKAMAASDGLDELLHRAHTALHDVLHVEHVFVFLFDAPRNELWTKFSVPGRTDPGTARVKMGAGLVGTAAQDRAVRVLGSDGVEGPEPLPALCRTSSEGAGRGPTGSGRLKPPAAPAGHVSFSAVPSPTASSGGASIASNGQHPVWPAGCARAGKGCAPAQLIDDDLLQQIAPALGDSPVTSVLVQPLLGDDKLVGCVLVVNKQESGSHRDILFEEDFTEADVEAMALFALELGNTLSDRSLECALASALSVVTHAAGPTTYLPQGSGLQVEVNSGKEDCGGSEASDELMVRSQLMSMYFQAAPDFRRPSSDCSAGSMSPTLLAPLSNNRARWQRSLTKLVATNRLSRSHSRLMSRMHGGMDRASHDGRTSAPTKPHSVPGMSAVALSPGATLVGPRVSIDTVRVSAVSTGASPVLVGPALLPPQSSTTAADSEPNSGPRTSLLTTQLQAGRANSSGGTGVASYPVHFERDRGSSTSSGGSADGGPGVSPFLVHSVRPDPGSSASPIAAAALAAAGPAKGEPQEPSFSVHVSGGSSPSPPPQSRQGRSLSAHAALAGRSPGRGRVRGPSVSVNGAVNGPDTLLDDVHEGRGRYGEEGSDGGTGEEDRRHNSGGISDNEGGCSTPSTMSPRVSDGVGSLPFPPLSSVPNQPLRRLSHAAGSGGFAATFFDPSVIYSWDVDLMDLDHSELVKLCYDLFITSGLVGHFNLRRRTLRTFLTTVAGHYQPVPYHNFTHVVHVLHGVCMFLRTATVRRALPPEEQLALLIAALCHDLDHDGCSNSYHVNSQSELARIYNDVSVMESHHCAMTWAILRRKDCALLEGLDKELQRRLRKGVCAAILSTDMSQHFGVTQDFKKHPILYDPDVEADRLLLTKVLLHASDIGAGVRPFTINDALSRRVHEEFQALAEKEAAEGLPITFAVDAGNPRMCAQVECNFLDYVVSPLWERLAEVVPELEPCYQQLMDNRRTYNVLSTAGGSTPPPPGPDAAHAGPGH